MSQPFNTASLPARLALDMLHDQTSWSISQFVSLPVFLWVFARVGKALASSDELGGLSVVCRMEVILCWVVSSFALLAEGADYHQELNY